MKRSASDKATLALAAHYLWQAATPHEKTREFLLELSRLVRGFDRNGPTVDLLDRLAEAISDVEEDAPALCEFRVTLDGPGVVIRIGCIPQET